MSKNLRKALMMLVLFVGCILIRPDQSYAATPFALYEGDELVGWYSDMMSAFAQMTEEDGEYLVIMDSDITACLVDEDYSWPKVKSLEIKSENGIFGLYAYGKQTINSDLILDGPNVYSSEIDIQSNKLVLKNNVQIRSGNVIGDTGSVVEKCVGSSMSVFFDGSLDIDTLLVTDGFVELSGIDQTYHINEVILVGSNSFSIGESWKGGTDSQTVHIGKFTYQGEYSNINLSVDTDTELYIGELVSEKTDDVWLDIHRLGSIDRMKYIDITFGGALTNVSEIRENMGYNIPDGSAIGDVVEEIVLFKALEFTGEVIGNYQAQLLDAEGNAIGEEDGSFSTYKSGASYYVDVDSFVKESEYWYPDDTTYTCGKYEYQLLEDKTAKITWYNWDNENVPEVLTIPDTLDGYKVTQIEDMGGSPSGLKEVVFPASVTYIDPSAFSGFLRIRTLERYTVKEGNTVYKSVDGVIYSLDGTTLYMVPAGRSSVEIPSTVTEIGVDAFLDCTKLTSLEIPDSVESIRSFAFACCSSLVRVKMPANLVYLEQRVFQDCSSLEEVILPTGSACDIGDNAFNYCTALKRIYIPENVEWVAGFAFENCTNLSEIIILGEDTNICGLTGIATNATYYAPEGSAAESLLAEDGITTLPLSKVNPIRLSDKSVALEKGETYQTYLYRNLYDSTWANYQISWSTSNASVATVDSNGKITATGKGEAVITATCGGKKKSMTVTVKETIRVTKITLNKSSAEVFVFEQLQLSATVYPSNAEDQGLVWTSSDHSVAWVGNTGLVTAQSEGTTTIKATAADGSGVVATCGIRVTKKNGLFKENNGTWHYYQNGYISYYTGLCKYNGNWWYIDGGTLDFSYTGLCKYNGSWFYVQNGMLNWKYTGLCKYNGSWFYVQNGVLNWKYTGLCKYNGSWFYVQNGVLNWKYTGLCKYNGSWYYVQKGVLNWKYTGLCKYNGSWYYVQKGVLNWKYTGYTTYGGARWYVKNGVMVRKA